MSPVAPALFTGMALVGLVGMTFAITTLWGPRKWAVLLLSAALSLLGIYLLALVT